jgi:hypothetical protein
MPSGARHHDLSVALDRSRQRNEMPVASGPGPGSVLPASQPIILAPSEIALSSDSARNPEPSIPVAENQRKRCHRYAPRSLLLAEDIACLIVVKPRA